MPLLPYKNPVKRLLAATKQKRITIGATGTTDYRGAVGGQSSPGAMGAHTALSDMPSALVDDHDGRYYTETEIDARVLDDIFDVDAPAPDDNDVLSFDSLSGTWVPVPAGAGSTNFDITDGVVTENVVGDVGTIEHSSASGKVLIALNAGVFDHDVDDSLIDHNALTNTHNLTTDIDHDSITNTHNLTTDIDHDSITNTHNLTTDIDHGSIDGLGDDDHTQYAKLAGRSGGQTLNGGTAAGDDLILNSTSHGTKGDVVLNTNFEVNGAGAHQNPYNGVATLVLGVVPDTITVAFGTALPDTDYTIQLTGRSHFYDYGVPTFIITAAGTLTLNGVFVNTSWHIASKTVNGFTATALHTVIKSTAPATEPTLSDVSVLHHGMLLSALATFYTFVAHNDNLLCDWAVRRY